MSRYEIRPISISFALDLLGGSGYNLISIMVACFSLAAGMAGAYYAKRAIPPRCRLSVECQTLAPLVQLRDGISDILVSCRGVSLREPYVTSIAVKNTGRSAIDSSQFDRGRPIEIALGVEIVKITKISISGSSSASTFRHDIEGEKVLLGPDLLKSRSSVLVQVLTEGEPRLGSIAEYLRGVEVQSSLGGAMRRRAEPASVIPKALVVNVVIAALSVLLMVAGIGLVAATYSLDELNPEIMAVDLPAPGSRISIVGVDFMPWRGVSFAIESREGRRELSTVDPGFRGVVRTYVDIPRGVVRGDRLYIEGTQGSKYAKLAVVMS